MLNLQELYNKLVNLNLNLIEYFIGIKFILIIASFIFNSYQNIFLLTQSILFLMLLILNNDIFSSLYLLLDFLSGLIGLSYFFENNNSYFLLLLTSIAPTVTIWIMAIFAVTFYNNVRRISYISYKKENKKDKRKIYKIKVDQEFICSICLEIGNDTGYYVCNNKHYYHYDCINKWITDFNKENCPTCRS